MPFLRSDDEQTDHKTCSESDQRELKELNFRHYPDFPTHMYVASACLQMYEEMLTGRYVESMNCTIFTLVTHEFASTLCYHESILQINFQHSAREVRCGATTA